MAEAMRTPQGSRMTMLEIPTTDYLEALLKTIAKGDAVCDEQTDYRTHFCGDAAVGYVMLGDAFTDGTMVCYRHGGYYSLVRELPLDPNEWTTLDIILWSRNICGLAEHARLCLTDEDPQFNLRSASILTDLGFPVATERGGAYGRAYTHWVPRGAKPPVSVTGKPLPYVREAPASAEKPSNPRSQAWRNVSPRLRYTVLQRDGFKCQLCGRTAEHDNVKLHVDHQQPGSKGGDNDDTNLDALLRLQRRQVEPRMTMTGHERYATPDATQSMRDALKHVQAARRILQVDSPLPERFLGLVQLSVAETILDEYLEGCW
jgi:hypothetical protein